MKTLTIRMPNLPEDALCCASLVAASNLSRRAWKNLNRLHCDALQSNWRDRNCRCGHTRPKVHHIPTCSLFGFADGLVRRISAGCTRSANPHPCYLDACFHSCFSAMILLLLLSRILVYSQFIAFQKLSSRTLLTTLSLVRDNLIASHA